MGLLAIVASVVLLLAAANLAEALSARWSWTLAATVLGVVAWLIASLAAFYALTKLLRLRRDRSVGLWLLLAAAYGVVVWIAGGVPLAPSPLRREPPTALAAERPLVPAEGTGARYLPLPPAQVAATRTPTATPTRAPTAPPSVTPLSSGGASGAPLWARNVDPTALWSAPTDDADSYTTVPPGAYFRILSATDNRYQVYYGGDRARRRPGEAWVDKGAVSASSWPQFVRTRQVVALQEEPRSASRQLLTVPAGGYLEVIQGGPGDWARVLYLGDGRDAGPQIGWVGAGALAPTDVEPTRIGRFLTTAAALARRPEVWLKVPYRSQLDGSAWAAANCGPTSVAMVLEAHGVQASPAEVRRRVMALQRTPNCDECGAFIENLAGAVEAYGLQSIGLQGDDGKLARWSLDDVRAALRAGHPVLAQVMYRQLPGREDSPYYGDHYVVVTGMLGDDFLYNDPIDDGPGYGRLIHPDQLRRAMVASDFPLAAFATALP
jgi:uncharacterized protein YvpB